MWTKLTGGLRRWSETMFDGEVTVTKRELWLAGMVCLLAGVVYGLVTAPWTHGVRIGCNNGNHNGNNNRNDSGLGEDAEACAGCAEEDEDGCGRCE